MTVEEITAIAVSDHDSPGIHDSPARDSALIDSAVIDSASGIHEAAPLRLVYKQSTGEIFLGAEKLGSGYSGRGDGLNCPELQDRSKVGPVPQGEYSIGEAGTVPHLGVEAMPLIPAESNEMFGRAGFYIHGDNTKMDHSASEGCIILNRAIRDKIAEGSVKQLRVIA